MRTFWVFRGAGRFLSGYLGTCFLVSVLMEILPGSPWSDLQRLPDEVHMATLMQSQASMPRLQEPLQWLIAVISGDFGPSWSWPEVSCRSIVLEALPFSLCLGSMALLSGWGIAWFAQIPRLRHLPTSTPNMVLQSLPLAIPSYLLMIGLLLMGLTSPFQSIEWRLLWGSLCLVPGIAAQGYLQLQRFMEAQLHLPYVRIAQLRGASPWQLLRDHLLRPVGAQWLVAAVPQMAMVLTGSIAIEKLLAIPGLGRWFLDGVVQRDVPMVLAITATFSLILFGLSWGAELLANWWDPRRRSLEGECSLLNT